MHFSLSFDGQLFLFALLWVEFTSRNNLFWWLVSGIFSDDIETLGCSCITLIRYIPVIPALRIRDVYPGSRIPDLGFGSGDNCTKRGGENFFGSYHCFVATNIIELQIKLFLNRQRTYF
jgi:hypothetical protein